MKRNIITRSPILYNKLSELNYKDSVNFRKVPNLKLNSILKNINFNDNIISASELNGIITLKKNKSCIFNVYKIK
jgi:hypothetical protein